MVNSPFSVDQIKLFIEHDNNLLTGVGLKGNRLSLDQIAFEAWGMVAEYSDYYKKLLEERIKGEK